MADKQHSIRVAKVLSRNELGLTGSHQAGVLVPKSSPLMELLPRLDPAEANPSTLIEFECLQLGEVIRVRYVHYNSKVLGTGTRNEQRLTRLGQLFARAGASPGDLLVFSFPKGNFQVDGSLATVSVEPGAEAEAEPRWTIEEIPFDEA